jgi:hypothetical protein
MLLLSNSRFMTSSSSPLSIGTAPLSRNMVHGTGSVEADIGWYLSHFATVYPKANRNLIFTGFVPDPTGKAYGRLVGVAVAADGSLLISYDGGKQIWRVSHTSDSSK